MRVDVPRSVVLYLLWLAFISGVLLVAMADALPFSLGIVHPGDVFTLLIEAELFFVLVVWPFFVPRLRRPAAVTPSSLATVGGESQLLLLQIAALFIVALPVALLSTKISNITTAEFFRGHLLVAVSASFVAAVLDAAAERKRNAAPAYFLALFLLSAGLPFVHFLASEHLGTAALRPLAAFSPFWAAACLDPQGAQPGAPLVLSAILGVAAGVLFAVAPFLRRSPASS